MSDNRPPQVWRYCATHDIEFLSRSPASLQHRTGRVMVEGEPPCAVRDGKR